MKKPIIFIAILLIVIIAVTYLIINKTTEQDISKIPLSTADCQKIDVGKYCSALRGAQVVYLPKGQTVSTGQGTTVRYDGEGTGSCSGGKINAVNQPITQEEQDNFKSFDLQIAFFNDAVKANEEFEKAAQQSNVTISNNQFSVIGALVATPNYPFNDRLLMQNNGKVNVQIIQFSAKQVSPYYSSDEEQALLNAF